MVPSHEKQLDDLAKLLFYIYVYIYTYGNEELPWLSYIYKYIYNQIYIGIWK